MLSGLNTTSKVYHGILNAVHDTRAQVLFCQNSYRDTDAAREIKYPGFWLQD